jgi:ubiquinone/menaquinone biosynthesis C-methylase UbiE
MIKFIKKIFWFPFSNKDQIERYQKEIRDVEWESFKHYIPKNSILLDVGCGAGYNITRAKNELNCIVTGIDPSPGDHGVGRFNEYLVHTNIIKGKAEIIPFEDSSFEIVFCSHVLEHVTDQKKSLAEINRVLTDDGLIIIGMPTATMAIIALISHYFFTTHVNILFFLKNIKNRNRFKFLINIFIPTSHSIPNHKYIFYDLNSYRIKKWENIVSKQFQIIDKITPCLYPYPDYIQWFPKVKRKSFSSSVFFICKKVKNGK